MFRITKKISKTNDQTSRDACKAEVNKFTLADIHTQLSSISKSLLYASVYRTVTRFISFLTAMWSDPILDNMVIMSLTS